MKQIDLPMVQYSTKQYIPIDTYESIMANLLGIKLFEETSVWGVYEQTNDLTVKTSKVYYIQKETFDKYYNQITEGKQTK